MLRLCLIGDPVAHSRSPEIQQELLQRAGIPGRYELAPVKAQDLPAFVAAARAGRYDGFNVTMPYKERIVPLLDALAPSAAAAGAVNTVVVRRGRAVGCNTDGPGFVRSLPFAASRRAFLLLGSGGAAKAIAAALELSGGQVSVCCRRPQPGQLPWERLSEAAARCHVLVNATPLGMAGCPDFADLGFLERLPTGALVYDLVYEPEETSLLRQARTLGLETRGGLALLRSQAELSFALFTGGEEQETESRQERNG